MTERDVARIEKALGVRLPAPYRQVLRDHAAAVARLKRTKDRFIPVYTTAAAAIAANAGLRADPWQQPTNDDREPWPLKYLVVGDDGGDCWCVNLNSGQDVLWRFDHEAAGRFVRNKPGSLRAHVELYARPP